MYSCLAATVLITGTSGGVGRFAVSLAARAGARAIAAVGSFARGEGLTGQVFGVLDNVGGWSTTRGSG